MVGLPEDGDGHLDRGRRRAGAEGDRPRRRRRARPGALARTRTRRRSRAQIVPRIDVPLVIDADGLNALAGGTSRSPAAAPLADGADPARGRARAAARRRLQGGRARAAAPRARGGGAVEGVRRAQGRRHAGRGAVRPRRDLARRARPGSPRPGTGDVLSGVIGAMLAKGMPVAHGRVRGRLRARARGPARRRAARPGRRDRLRRDRRAARRAQRQPSIAMALTVRDVMDAESRVRPRGRPDRARAGACCASTSCPASRWSTRATAASGSSPSAT